MANIKISELNELSTGADNDYLPIVDSSENETKKMNLKNLKDYNIGDLEELETEDKSSLINAINELKGRIDDIVESGSNNNGNWIKYEDGTMICWNVISGNIFDCTQSAGNGRYYYVDTNDSAENHKLWTYPVEFKSGTLPTVSVGVSSSAYTMPSIGGVSASWCTGYCATPYPVDGTRFNWHFIAMGKWK